MMQSLQNVSLTCPGNRAGTASVLLDHLKLETTMRKETKKIAEAFLNHQPANAARTSTDGEAVYLHGNKIAYQAAGHVWLTMAGWGTNTTRERLNGIAETAGYGRPFHQKNGVQYCHNYKISPFDHIQLDTIPMAAK